MLAMMLKQSLLKWRKGLMGTETIVFGINGFGRIGRTAFRVWWNEYRDQATLAVVNTSGSMEIEDWVHLIKYDSNYGQFTEEMDVKRLQGKDDVSDENPVLGTIRIGGKEIVVTAQRDPAKIPWSKYGVKTVIESTGVFLTTEKASGHLKAGAEKVVLSAPAKDDNISIGVLGVNQLSTSEQIFSNASCTTNCITPVAAVINEKFGVEKAMLTTVHSYTDDQNTQDNSHRDLRRARTAAQNIIPTSTGAAIATTKVIPELTGKFDGMAIRVPTPVGSISDMVFLIKRDTTIDEVNQVLTTASQESRFHKILAVTKEPLVSRDIVGRSESSIVDLSLTQVVGGNLIKVVSWYDNEMGYCHRLIEQTIAVSK